MSAQDALRVAFRAIAANGLRSLLTALGMVIGVGSVIVLIAVGQGAQKGVQDQIRGLGKDLIFIQPTPPTARENGGARGAAGAGQTLTVSSDEALGSAPAIATTGLSTASAASSASTASVISLPAGSIQTSRFSPNRLSAAASSTSSAGFALMEAEVTANFAAPRPSRRRPASPRDWPSS